MPEILVFNVCKIFLLHQMEFNIPTTLSALNLLLRLSEQQIEDKSSKHGSSYVFSIFSNTDLFHLHERTMAVGMTGKENFYGIK